MTRRASSPKSVRAYIAHAPEFARPICEKLRQLILKSSPEIREAIKWGSPCYEGRSLVCGFGAFKAHVSLAFFKGAELPDPDGLLVHGDGNATMRSVKFSSAQEIPMRGLQRLVRTAFQLDAAATARSVSRVRKPEPRRPDDLAQALARAPKAQAFFDTLPPSCRREYIEWITTAKKEETRLRRLRVTVDKLQQGRRPNEEYRRNG